MQEKGEKLGRKLVTRAACQIKFTNQGKSSVKLVSRLISDYDATNCVAEADHTHTPRWRHWSIKQQQIELQQHVEHKQQQQQQL